VYFIIILNGLLYQDLWVAAGQDEAALTGNEYDGVSSYAVGPADAPLQLAGPSSLTPFEEHSDGSIPGSIR
jgi:hypothetical protein